jgi:Ca2+-binding EF-hand superfamily protein
MVKVTSWYLQGFAPGTRMTPSEFTEQLRRNFGVYLTPSELAALVQKCDKDGDGQVSASEFMKTFKDLGK